jgi:hypothetical protein
MYSAYFNQLLNPSSLQFPMNRLFLCLLNYFKIRNLQSKIRNRIPDTRHLKPRLELHPFNICPQLGNFNTEANTLDPF